jgi:glycosyltransferase involved in cell wall biosynthesis
MVVRVLSIGDTANFMQILSKFTKRSEIHVINFPLQGNSKHVYSKNIEFFDSWKASDCVKKINEIKDEYDVCIAFGAGALIAYLADLNFIVYMLGSDIRTPYFEKNAGTTYLKEPIHKLNYFERRIHKKVLDNAVLCAALGGELYKKLKKYRKDAIRIDRVAVDTSIFNPSVKPIERKKTKFTFFSPSRFSMEKGFDYVWDAIKLCKSDFEILQVEWFDERTPEEEKINKKLLENRPPQVKIIPLIKREEISKYYMFADAIIGAMGDCCHEGCVEREAVMCGKPVLSYHDIKDKYIINGKELETPFVPKSQDPKELAELIDRIVVDSVFQKKLAEEENEFIKEVANPIKAAELWDSIFEDVYQKFGGIKQNSMKIFVKFRNLYFQVANRLYLSYFKTLWK